MLLQNHARVFARHSDAASELVRADIATLVAELNPGGQLPADKAPNYGIGLVVIDGHEVGGVHIGLGGFGIQLLACVGWRSGCVGRVVAEIFVMQQDVFLAIFRDEVAWRDPSRAGGGDPLAQVFGEGQRHLAHAEGVVLQLL